MVSKPLFSIVKKEWINLAAAVASAVHSKGSMPPRIQDVFPGQSLDTMLSVRFSYMMETLASFSTADVKVDSKTKDDMARLASEVGSNGTHVKQAVELMKARDVACTNFTEWVKTWVDMLKIGSLTKIHEHLVDTAAKAQANRAEEGNAEEDKAEKNEDAGGSSLPTPTSVSLSEVVSFTDFEELRSNAASSAGVKLDAGLIKNAERFMESLIWMRFCGTDFMKHFSQITVNFSTKNPPLTATLVNADFQLVYAGSLSMLKTDKGVSVGHMFGIEFFLNPGGSNSLYADCIVPAWLVKFTKACGETFWSPVSQSL